MFRPPTMAPAPLIDDVRNAEGHSMFRPPTMAPAPLIDGVRNAEVRLTVLQNLLGKRLITKAESSWPSANAF